MQSRVSAAAQCDILVDPGSFHLSALPSSTFCFCFSSLLPHGHKVAATTSDIMSSLHGFMQEGNQKSKRKSMDGAIIYSFIQWRAESQGELSQLLPPNHMTTSAAKEARKRPTCSETTNLHLLPKHKIGSSVSKNRELWWLCKHKW